MYFYSGPLMYFYSGVDNKPDGLDVIDHTNVLNVYRQISLLDLNGINTRYQARLNAHGIFTPLDFYAAPLPLLKQQVFRSINGYYWYLRLRGYEIDAVDFARKSFGNTYALQQQTNDPRALAQLLMKLCEKTERSPIRPCVRSSRSVSHCSKPPIRQR